MKKQITVVLAMSFLLGMGTNVFAATATPSTADLQVNGTSASAQAYTIDGYTYFKLRDLGKLLGFTVGWDAKTSSIAITTPWAEETKTVPTQKEKEETEAEKAERFAEEVIRLTNEERKKEGLSPLGTMDSLSKAAQIRAEELKELYAHERPDGSSCFTVLEEVNLTNYHALGENIALGQATPEQVVEAWMHSEVHRKNILNAKYDKIGVGYASNNGWVQIFCGEN